jgi:hypothetical protein
VRVAHDLHEKKGISMGTGSRSTLVLVLAAAGALVVAGIALAAGNSTLTFKFKCAGRSVWNKCPKTTYKTGQIKVHAHYDYTGATATDKVKLNLDDDFRVNPSATPKCDKSKLSGNLTMKRAMNRCGSALIGKGTATAKAGPNAVRACLLAFNGKANPAGKAQVLLFTRASTIAPFTINCSNPANNTNGSTAVLLTGILGANPPSLGRDFSGGSQLLFKNITQAAPVPLLHFNLTLGQPKVASAKNYVQARCHDTDKIWNARATFTYVSPSGSQIVHTKKACTVG